jgi:hypothetical protein
MMLRLRIPGVSPVRLRSKDAAHALLCRPGTSDKWIFDQIFIQREYRSLDDLEEAGLIIDCGANVGNSAAYLLTHFPN